MNVLIELVVTDRADPWIEAQSLLADLVLLDPLYPAVPMPPAEEDLALVGADQTLVLVRGTLLPGVALEDVLPTTAVRRAWTDGEIAPFDISPKG